METTIFTTTLVILVCINSIASTVTIIIMVLLSRHSVDTGLFLSIVWYMQPTYNICIILGSQLAQSALERHRPTLRTPTLHGHPVLRTVCFVPGKRKPAVTFSQNSTGLILGGVGGGGGGGGVSVHNSHHHHHHQSLFIHEIVSFYMVPRNRV